jgi:hypothetical protein
VLLWPIGAPPLPALAFQVGEDHAALAFLDLLDIERSRFRMSAMYAWTTGATPSSTTRKHRQRRSFRLARNRPGRLR